MNSSNEFPVLFWPFFALIVAYNGAVFYLLHYLRRAHNQLWLDLGSPSFLNNSILNGFRVIGFLLGSRYKSLNDPKVSGLVQAIRVMFVGCLVLFAFVLTGVFKP